MSGNKNNKNLKPKQNSASDKSAANTTKPVIDPAKAKIYWITQTAVAIALLVVIQAATAPLGNQLITGTLVNALLIISVMLPGLSSGITVAVLSPILARLFGIGPLWPIVPFVLLGNVVLVIVWFFMGNYAKAKMMNRYIYATILGAIWKFVVLYLGIVRLAVPIILKLPNPQAKVISTMFSAPQLITAILGGALATILVPVLRHALQNAYKQ